MIGTSNSGSNIVGTSHEQGSTAVGQYLRKKQYTLRVVVHNHPSGVNLPSEGDVKGAAKYYNANSNTKLFIYSKIAGKRQYHRTSTPYTVVKDKNGNIVSVVPVF